jgi:hypothetical protein
MTRLLSRCWLVYNLRTPDTDTLTLYKIHVFQIRFLSAYSVFACPVMTVLHRSVRDRHNIVRRISQGFSLLVSVPSALEFFWRPRNVAGQILSQVFHACYCCFLNTSEIEVFLLLNIQLLEILHNVILDIHKHQLELL